VHQLCIRVVFSQIKNDHFFLDLCFSKQSYRRTEGREDYVSIKADPSDMIDHLLDGSRCVTSYIYMRRLNFSYKNDYKIYTSTMLESGLTCIKTRYYSPCGGVGLFRSMPTFNFLPSSSLTRLCFLMSS
jgi:hypothetical protein